MTRRKTMERLLSGTADASIRFEELCSLLRHLGFDERVRGSHHIFRRPGIEEMINLQSTGGRAKPYQVKQARAIIHKAGRGDTVNKYEVIIYWSDEDHSFVAEIPELPGCMAHGDTHEAALESAKEAMELWVDTARQDGRSVPKPKGRRLVLA